MKWVDIEPAPADQLRQKTLDGCIDGLRGMAWAFAVLHYLRINPSQASEIFRDPKSLSSGRANNFYAYRDGVRCPMQGKGKRGKYGFDLVEAVDSYKDNKAKHAKPWLNHALLKMFSSEASIDRISELPDVVTEKMELALRFHEVGADELGLLDKSTDAPTLEFFDDYIYVCAEFRRYYVRDVFAPRRWLIPYLADQAAELDPTFRRIKLPFLKMLDVYYPEPTNVPPEKYKAALSNYLVAKHMKS